VLSVCRNARADDEIRHIELAVSFFYGQTHHSFVHVLDGKNWSTSDENVDRVS